MTLLAKLGLTAPRTAVDWALGGLGLGAATTSAGFAAYMLVLSPKESASGEFRIFAQFDHRYHPSPGGQGDLTAEASGAETEGDPASPNRRTAEASSVDLTPTGSLQVPSQLSQGGDPATRAGSGPYSPEAHALPDFQIRDVFEGHALVESRSSLSVVRPGSMLAGAGRVINIEKRDGRWVVVTETGYIAASAR